MAAKEVVAFDEVTNQFKAPQSGDTYSLPRSVSVTGNTTVSGNVSASGTVTAGGALSADRMNVGGNVASTTGRVKVNAVEFADGTTALTAQAASGSQNIDSVLGQGNTTLKRITTGGYDMAAVTATLPPITIVASDDFDNSQDSAWIDRCSDKSWENEARSGTILATSNYANATAAVAAGIVTGDGFYNTTTAQFEEVTGATTSTITYRAGSRKFPMEVLATAEAGRVIIWDSTSGQPEMWKTYITGSHFFLGGSATVSSVAISGHKIAIGTTANGMFVWDFVEDSSVNRVSKGAAKRFDMSNANSSTPAYSVIKPSSIVNNSVNSVAITYLPDAPLDEYGMRVPTVYAFTFGGVSRIAHDGTISSTTTSTGNVVGGGIFSNYVIAMSIGGGATHLLTSYPLAATLPTGGASHLGSYWGFDTSVTQSATTIAVPPIIGPLPIGSMNMAGNIAAGMNGMLGILRNPSTGGSAMSYIITNTYNTGWMVGDIRRAFLCNSLTADRSVKGGALTMTGTITETVNAGGVNVYSGFSAANYLSEPSHADWNALGTGDFSFSMWVVGVATQQTFIFSIGGGSSGDMIGLYNPGTLVFTPRIGNISIGSTIGFNGTMQHVVMARKNGILTLHVDSILALTTPNTVNVSAPLASLVIGSNYTKTWGGTQTSLFRISATAPTPEQIKHMYETERKLFEPNAQALLSSSPSVTDLKYNKQHDTYYVKNGTNVDEFKGLQRTDSMVLATGVTTSGNPLAAPVLSTSGTTNIFKAPAVDMNSSIKALGLQLADAKQGTVIKTITSSAASVLTMPQGFKPIRVTSATGTYVSLSTNAPTYDGFIWSITTGLAANTAYDVEMRRV